MHSGTAKTKVNPTQIRDLLGHPVCSDVQLILKILIYFSVGGVFRPRRHRGGRDVLCRLAPLVVELHVGAECLPEGVSAKGVR